MSEKSENQPRQQDGRPDPEELLKRYNLKDADQEQHDDIVQLKSRDTGLNYQASSTDDDNLYPEHHHRPGDRGHLRIYLGAVAGAGKTYAMLNEGNRRKARGTDVVVGFVETHQRVQTQAQLKELEVIPRKKIIYRGVTLEEMDTEAIIARHPELTLVDELAHTNVPGSKRNKRYQDVEDLLDAGIDVVTTLNVQHLESLNDMVTSITGVQVRETLPDQILDQADEVELIDISPVALRQRMKHGNIYPAERIEPALNNFFREGNLTALRELALRRTADKTESQLQHYMDDHHINQLWPATERVLVGFDQRPHSRRVIRDAWRLAHGLHADLIAVYIQPVGYLLFTSKIIAFLKFGQDTPKQYIAAQQRLKEHILLAEDLGAEVIQRSSSDIARTMVEIAKEHQVTQIVLGQPTRSHWEEILRGSMINRLLRMSQEIDIHLVPQNRKAER